jgi:protein-S-isoprenylcysteine O-methyltransferase Ste14
MATAEQRRARTGWLLVAAQMVLLAALAVLTVPALRGPVWGATGALGIVLAVVGWVLLGLGAAVGVLGLTGLGAALTPTPVPVDGVPLRTDGVYGRVRHPIYTGLLLGGAGIVLVTQSWIGLAVWVALLALLTGKARWEESLLAQRHPQYGSYAAVTPRFLPRPRRRP